jgi:GAF domain-containing protein
VDAYGADERYREFAAACRAAGVPESLSIGLPVRHRTAVGALNVYGGPFTDEDVELAVALAGHAAVAVANAALYQSMADLAENLQVAMQSRAVIEQAKGIIMARRNGSPDQAFEWLRVRSQHANVKVRDIAQRIVDARGG